ncbi:MAG: HAMP domain-containing sensor histidine kinase [bacterium]
MTHNSAIVVTAVLWAVGGGALGWAVTVPLRRTFAGQLASPVIIATFATLAAIFGSERAMFYASGDFRVALIVAAAAGLVAATTVFLSARALARDRRALVEAVEAVGAGRRPVPAEDVRRMGSELQSLRRQVEDAGRRLAEAADRERSLERSRRELIAWVSHDLRTPLAGLRAMAEALEDGLVENPERYYKQIRLEVDTLTEMVDDLFQLSRIQAGALRLSNEPVHLDDLVSDTLAALEPLAAAQLVQLEGAADRPVVVAGDSRELSRAVTNLVVNAVRHTPEHGTVHLDVTTPTDSPGAAEVSVTDQCGGIPPEELDRLFDVGFRGEPARTPDATVPGGAGLGLAITRGIAEAHDGSVTVANVDGGCRFTLRLPLAT